MTEQTNGVAVPVGMKPWHGGDSAPADWDGGPVQARTGEVRAFSEQDWRDWQDWTDTGLEMDIIAYTPRPANQPEDDPDAATGCADDLLPGSVAKWRKAVQRQPKDGEVTQGDREAARAFQIEHRMTPMQAETLAIAFARHRLAHADTQTAALRAANEGREQAMRGIIGRLERERDALREAVRPFAAHVTPFILAHDQNERPANTPHLARHYAAARAALPGERKA